MQDNTIHQDEMPTDEYMQAVIGISNDTNSVHNKLEKILEIEEWKQQSSFLDNLTQIEAWCDKIASQQQKRLEYINKRKQ